MAMTYRELLNYLESAKEKGDPILDQDVTVKMIGDDEYMPIVALDMAGDQQSVLDADHYVLLGAE